VGTSCGRDNNEMGSKNTKVHFYFLASFFVHSSEYQRTRSAVIHTFKLKQKDSAQASLAMALYRHVVWGGGELA
jgi:hypothetical protein